MPSRSTSARWRFEEKALGPDHPDVATSLNNLAVLYRQPRPLRRRRAALQAGAGDPGEGARARPSRCRSLSLNNLAELYREPRLATPTPSRSTSGRWRSGRRRSARPSRCRDIAEQPGCALRNQGRYADAEPLYKRALAIREKALGADHPDVADTLNNLADPLRQQRQQRKRTRLFAQSDGCRHRSRSHRDDRRAAQRGRGRSRRAAHGLLCSSCRQSCSGGAASGSSRRRSSAAKRSSWRNGRLVGGRGRGPANGPALCRRHRRLAALVRERQDLSAFWRGLDKALIEALAKPEGQRNAARIEAIRKQVAGHRECACRQRRPSGGRVSRTMRRWRTRSRSTRRRCKTSSAREEALVFFLAGDKESYVFALTREAFEWKTIPLGAAALSEKVTAFRRGLDVDALRRGLQRVECAQAEADKRGLGARGLRAGQRSARAVRSRRSRTSFTARSSVRSRRWSGTSSISSWCPRARSRRCRSICW